VDNNYLAQKNNGDDEFLWMMKFEDDEDDEDRGLRIIL